MTKQTHTMGRITSAAGVVAMAAVVVSGCTASPVDDNAADPVTIDLLAFTTPNLDEQFWSTATSRAASAVGDDVTVDVLYSPDADRQAYARQLASTGQLPDIIWDVVPELAEAGDLLPYPDTAFDDFVISPLTVAGKHYGYPAGAQIIPLVFYNTDMFASAGITEEPTTWAEFVETAEKLKSSGVTPIMIGGGADTWASSILLDGILTIDLLGGDREWVTKLHAGEVAWTDDNVVESIAKWADLLQRDLVNTDALSLDHGQMQESFLAGATAMYPMGSWAAAMVSDDFEVGVFPLPGERGTDVTPVALGNSTAVSAASDHPEIAQAVAHQLATDVGFAEASLHADALFPTLRDFAVPEDTADLIKQSYQYFSDAPERVLTLNWGGGDLGLPSSFSTEFRTIAQKVIAGVLDASGATVALQEAWTAATAR